MSFAVECEEKFTLGGGKSDFDVVTQIVQKVTSLESPFIAH